MVTQRSNTLNQELDIGGSFNHDQSLVPGDEPQYLGRIINSGNGTSQIVTSNVTLNGLSGMTAAAIGNYMQLSGFSNANNNGTFLISEYINSTQVRIINTAAVTEAASFLYNNRKPYSLEDDINYIRTDRANIKGTDYFDPIPTYTRCEDQNTLIPANLSNIAGNTLDAKSLVVTRKISDISVVPGNAFITLVQAGSLKHADAVNVTGVPIYDGFDLGNNESTYVNVLDGYGLKITVIDGSQTGYRVYGRTKAGSSTSPNSVEVEFRCVEEGANLSTNMPYIWELSQSNLVAMYYAYRECMSDLDENALRVNEINGLVSNSGSGTGLPKATQVGQVLYSIDGVNFQKAMPVTSNAGWLVNDQGYLLVAED